MTRSSRDPDAYDRIRDDKLTSDFAEPMFGPAALEAQAARIAELEARLADATVALQLIAAYGPDGICPYGCDTPDIAANALTAQPDSGGGEGK